MADFLLLTLVTFLALAQGRAIRETSIRIARLERRVSRLEKAEVDE